MKKLPPKNTVAVGKIFDKLANRLADYLEKCGLLSIPDKISAFLARLPTFLTKLPDKIDKIFNMHGATSAVYTRYIRDSWQDFVSCSSSQKCLKNFCLVFMYISSILRDRRQILLLNLSEFKQIN